MFPPPSKARTGSMTEDDQKPTEEGRKRYPPDGKYDGEFVCTCNVNCPDNCKGQCGCQACHVSYGDFLSAE